jgi:hypothetical protein
MKVDFALYGEGAKGVGNEVMMPGAAPRLLKELQPKFRATFVGLRTIRNAIAISYGKPPNKTHCQALFSYLSRAVIVLVITI